MQAVVEKSTKISTTSPVEMFEATAFENDSVKLAFEKIKLVIEFIEDLGLSVFVDEDPAEAHLEGGPLEVPREAIGCSGVFVKLGENFVEDFGGDATVDAIVNEIPFGLCSQVLREDCRGVNDFHCFVVDTVWEKAIIA